MSAAHGTSAGRVVAVHRNPEHGFAKMAAASIHLLRGLGVEGDAHCGACSKCRERREAFRSAGVKDETRYADGGRQRD